MVPADCSLRPASAEDALCLSVLAMQVFLDTYATQGIRPAIAREVLSGYSEPVFARANASEGVRISVAELAGHLIGFAEVQVGATQALAPGRAQSELLRLYVQEPFTGKRVGTPLLAEAERLALEAGTEVLWLTPWAHNHRAIGFYASRGYSDCGCTHFTFEGEVYENRVHARFIATSGSAAPGGQ